MDPTYKGFMLIPETNTWIKLGGYAKVDSIVDSTKLGNPNKLVTNGIPVAGEANDGKGQTYNIHAKQSRFNVELRTPSPLGSVRFFYENDFFANSAATDAGSDTSVGTAMPRAAFAPAAASACSSGSRRRPAKATR